MAARPWTAEQRRQASDRARAQQPWRHATGPRTAGGRAVTRLNALKHGARSRAARDLLGVLAEWKRVRRRAVAELTAPFSPLHDSFSVTPPAPAAPSIFSCEIPFPLLKLTQDKK